MLNTDMESLKKVCVDFYNVTKMMIVLYDEKRNVLYSFPESMCGFCEEIRKDEHLAKMCLECDKNGLDICDKTREKYSYHCHMGLTEAIAPILENGIIIGYMMLGQVLDNRGKDVLTQRVKAISKQYRVNAKVLEEEIKDMQIVSKEAIVSAADIMEMCACYLWLNQIISVHINSMSQHLSNYIEENLSGDLSVKALCNYLHVSKSTLYKCSITSFHMGISDYIRYKRIQETKKLLKNKDASVAQIAQTVGIYDANYFTKIFKRYTGVTPSEYR